jgi:hypothetical protein
MPLAQLLGRGAKVNLAIESTFGTPQSQAAFSLRVESLEHSAGVDRPLLHGLGIGAKGFAGATYTAAKAITGSIRVRGHYRVEGFATLLRWALWGTWGTTGSGPYVHTLSAGGTKLGATLRFNTGDAIGGANDEAVTVSGAVCTSYELSMTAPGVMDITCNFIALASTRSDTAHTLNAAASTNSPILHHQGSALAWNSITKALASLRLTVDNALEGLPQIGTLGPADFVHSGPRTVVMTCEALDAGEAWATAQADGDVSDAVISFTDGTDTLELTLSDAVIRDPVADSITGPNAKRVSIVFHGTTDDPLSIELTNGNSSAEAA